MCACVRVTVIKASLYARVAVELPRVVTNSTLHACTPLHAPEDILSRITKQLTVFTVVQMQEEAVGDKKGLSLPLPKL